MHRLIEYRPPRIAMLIVLLAVSMNLLLPMRLHAALPIAAALIAITGFSLMLRAWWLFRLAGTAICPRAASQSLITRDVYAITRNPMYLGMSLMLAGLALASGGAAFYAALITYVWILDRVFIPYEEQKASREFGTAYKNYASRVRRWL